MKNRYILVNFKSQSHLYDFHILDSIVTFTKCMHHNVIHRQNCKSFCTHTLKKFIFLLSMLHVSIQQNNKNVSPHQKAEGIYEKIAKSFYFSVMLFLVACYMLPFLLFCI